MENILEISATSRRKQPMLPKVAILIYWAASFQYLFSLFFSPKIVRASVPVRTMPSALLYGLFAFLLAVGLLKLFLAFKLSKRRNWARFVVVAIALAQAVFVVPGTIAMAQVSQQAVFALFANAWGLYAEMVTAVLLLLPQSWSWFAPER
jgi:hypothetical protein